jgi:DNA-directed RNA polymerase specialized sigma24 family protein
VQLDDHRRCDSRLDGERVRRALVATYGVEIGTEAAAEALALAWERWDSLQVMTNPAGYLYRIGQSRARPHVRWSMRRRPFPTSGSSATDRAHQVQRTADSPALDDLFAALSRLAPDQRAAVLLVKSYGYSHREVADLLGRSEAVVNNLVHRGVQQLRSMMKESL